MAYKPIGGSLQQFARNAAGASASTYYLKGYVSGTDTPLSMGIDATPSSTLAKCALNSRGEPISNDADENSWFIPHFNEPYRLVLYANATDADNNTLASAVWDVDGLNLDFDATSLSVTVNGLQRTSVESYLNNKEVADYAALRVLPVAQLADGDACTITGSGISGLGYFRNVVGHGLADNGGTIVVISADWYWQREASTAYNVAWFGATRGTSDDNTVSIQTANDVAFTDGSTLTGVGTYYVGSTVTLTADIDSNAEWTIEPLPSFASEETVDFDILARRVVILNQQHQKVRNLRVRNGNAVSDLVGIDYAKPQIKSINTGGIGFRVNNLVRNFSISIYEGRGVNGGPTGKGLVAYAPDFNNEINALSINGGEWFGNQGGAIDIGDRDGLFTTTLGPTDYMGNSIRVKGYPTLDQGFLSVDRVIDFKCEIYFENGGAGLESAVLLGGTAQNSVRGFEISGYARDYDYYVKCVAGVSGINMHDCFSRQITKSALYLTTDQYQFRYSDNQSIASFTEGQEVHTGVRFGLSSYFFGGQKTIEPYNLVNGSTQGQSSNHIYAERVDQDAFIYKQYITTSTARSWGRLFLPGTGSSESCTVSGDTATFASAAEIQPFNGGDIVLLGAALCYIVTVDYVALTLRVQLLSGSLPSGATTIAQEEVTPKLTGYANGAPTRTDGRQGSVLHNQNMAVGQPVGWAYDGAAWQPLANL